MKVLRWSFTDSLNFEKLAEANDKIAMTKEDFYFQLIIVDELN